MPIFNHGLPIAAKFIEGGEVEQFDYSLYGLPILKLTGDVSAMTKDNAVTLNYTYGDLSGTCTCKWQGSSSLAHPKKNYTIKFDNAFEAVEGWGAEKKYCFKANFIDHSHARNLISAKLWGQIVKSRKLSGGITGAVSTSEANTSAYVSVEDNVVSVKTSVWRSGCILFTGKTYPAGEHTITFEVFNPIEGDQSFAQLVYGVPGTEGTDFKTANINTKEKYGEWLPRSATVVFHVDGSMIGLVPYSPTGDTEGNIGYKFRNIKVDGEVYPLTPYSPLNDLPNGGAVDGFPCIIELNGEFHGLYTWNIPKDGWMFGMTDETANEAIVCAEGGSYASCGFKELATLNGDFELEYVSDENNSDWVLSSLNTLIGAVMNSDGTDLDTTIAKYLDWQSAIDYLIFTVLLRGGDMIRKNYIMATFDGVKWFFSAYDMDSTYGLQWTGKGFDGSKGYPNLTDYNHKVMELIKQYKAEELKARYKEIRNSVMSEDNLYLMFTNFGANLPTPVLAEDVKKWTTIPSSSVNNVAQILNWYRMRVAVIDKEIERM